MAEKDLIIRPFARLLTMLGDQLIKNEQIAVIELIKNSYDADADWVKVSFEGFTESFDITKDSTIVIEDNGHGMISSVIEKSWMSPATPNKFSVNGEERKSFKYHRIIQGEKGIGRYAMLKLGKTINLTTRPEDDKEHDKEYTLSFDLSKYDDDFIVGASDGQDGIYLDELSFKLLERIPETFVPKDVLVSNMKYVGDDNTHGTRIEISNLSGSWSLSKLKPIKDSFLRFGDLFSELTGTNSKRNKFAIGLYINGKEWNEETKGKDITLKNLIDTQSVLRIKNGTYYSKAKMFSFCQNDVEKRINIEDLRGLTSFKQNFYNKTEDTYREVSDFGDFEFDFYIFDFAARVDSKFYLPREAKEVIKKHRIYLLRDDIRVLPYGDPDDDWLQIEVKRGTVRAGDFLSNDQVIGRIKISKFGNPHLRDKTNREGLIEDGYYTSDFISIIQSFLSFLRNGAYAAYLNDQKKKAQIASVRRDAVGREIQSLKEQLKGNSQALSYLSKLENAYQTEVRYQNCRVEQTESLAAVGLSVETASHDIMMMLNKGVDELRALYEDSQYPNFDSATITPELQKLYGIFSYVQNQMKDMQLLFTSSKQRRRQLRVKDILEKVLTIYRRTLAERHIDCKVDVVGSPLMAKCTDADLLQLLINLLDNAIYWLADIKEKQIIITLDGKKCKLIFSDNGLGIRKDDEPYIFEAFYSGKGEEGRGLGLYISRKLMERNNYSIELADVNDDRILSGANFVVNFVKNGNNED